MEAKKFPKPEEADEPIIERSYGEKVLLEAGRRGMISQFFRKR